jgi:hypothetical protein
MLQMISTIFDTTSAELASLVDLGEVADKAIQEEAIVSFLEIRASKAQLEEIRGKLQEIIQSVGAVEEDAAESDEEAGQAPYRLTLAYYPLYKAKHAPRRKS